MAINREVVENEADAVRNVCEEMVRLFSRIHWILEHNSDLSIDWAAGTTPAYITEIQAGAVGAGNIDTRPFTRQQVANAIGSLDQIRKLLTNQATSQGDHLGNLNVLARPLH